MLQINDKWRIDTSDGRNCTLQKQVTRTVKDTEEKYTEWENQSYYSTVPAALKGYCLENLKKAKDIPSLIERLDKLEKQFDFFQTKKQEDRWKRS